MAGDEILAAVSKCLHHIVPADGYVGRFGGDEFCIAVRLGPEQNPNEFVNDLHQKIAAIEVDWQQITIAVQVTSGAVIHEPDTHTDAVGLIGQADRLLIQAKARQKGSVSWQALAG